MKQTIYNYLREFCRNPIVFALGMAGFALHAGSAALRIARFFPYPQLLDFSGFYAASAALRAGLNPYTAPNAFIDSLRMAQHIPFRPPLIYNPPFWAWLLQPFTCFFFPVSAWLWVIFNLGILGCCVMALSKLAAVRGMNQRLGLGILVLTFGPVVLDISLGQTSIVLLAGALAIGQLLDRRSRISEWGIGIIQALLVGVKLFPVIWLGAFVLLHRWRMVGLCFLLTAGILSSLWVAYPPANRLYWQGFLGGRLESALTAPGIDDQSLTACLQRLMLSERYIVPALRPEVRDTIQWQPPLTIFPAWPRYISHAISIILLLQCAFLLWRLPGGDLQAGFFLWLVLGLVILAHIERYNHALLLPALAWLWGRGQHTHSLVIAVYFLCGISRLNHLWVIALHYPWAAVISAAGLGAVVLAGWAIANEMRSARTMITVRLHQ